MCILWELIFSGFLMFQKSIGRPCKNRAGKMQLLRKFLLSRFLMLQESIGRSCKGATRKM
jgi:hypothetical protein